MQNATVKLSFEVSHPTADAVDVISKRLGTTPERFASFLLRKGFSNLSDSANKKGESFAR